ncbi:hypothetical protein Syun_008217 [Stephania yunnanensis]|uniref:Polygalacturonase n=1 Tax=Stephania yunnanensis TaxID=152371 RepID=A0AAP0Q369_9MAGN
MRGFLNDDRSLHVAWIRMFDRVFATLKAGEEKRRRGRVFGFGPEVFVFWRAETVTFNDALLSLVVEALLLVSLIFEAQLWAVNGNSRCENLKPLEVRPHSVTITEFGAVGDGVTLNTKAFQNAIFYLQSFADKGGAQLFVPKGQWLTGSFELISHLTLLLDKEAVILGSEDSSDWPIDDPLPSYGRGRELPGRRHRSLIYGNNLTDVVITDSSDNVCIEDCYISTGDDLIVIKSGWDEYGIAFGRPSSNITIRRISGQTGSSSGLAIGSEMSGGVSEVYAEDLHFFNSANVAIRFTGQYGEHPDESYDPKALPVIDKITIRNIKGENISFAGVIEGIEGDNFTNICLSNVLLNVKQTPPWNCSYVQGYSDLVSPEICEVLSENIYPGHLSDCYFPFSRLQSSIGQETNALLPR